jgi:hypothetical protein
LNRIFVKPCSGAHRATWTQQHAQRFACLIGRPRWLVSSRRRVRGLAVLLGHNNTLNVSRALSGAPVESELHKAGFRGSPCCLDDKQHAQCFACGLGRPRWLVSSRRRVRGFAVLLGHNNTLNVSRALSGAPDGLFLRGAVFGGSPCHLDTTTRSTFRVPYRAPPMACFFVAPCSGARRATWTQQHAQRFACNLGCPLAPAPPAVEANLAVTEESSRPR